jgi:hypothetical protein
VIEITGMGGGGVRTALRRHRKINRSQRGKNLMERKYFNIMILGNIVTSFRTHTYRDSHPITPLSGVGKWARDIYERNENWHIKFP